MKINKLIALAIGAILALPAFGQSKDPYQGIIKYNDVKVNRVNNQVSISANAMLSDLDLASRQMIIITPMIVSKDKRHQVAFPPVVVTGRNRTKALARELRFGTALPEAVGAEKYVRRYNGKSQDVQIVTSTIPYASWMVQSDLVIKEHTTGCAQCPMGESLVALLRNPFFDPCLAPYKLGTMEIPSEEIPKNRTLSFKAYINFEWDKSVVKKDLSENEKELARVDKFLTDIKANATTNVDLMTIVGWTSIEGTMQYNKGLSLRRAEMLADMLKKQYGPSLPKIKCVGNGEDWKTFRDVVEAGNFVGKDKVLRIIDGNYANDDLREKAIVALGTPIYNNLFKNYFPASRRDEIFVKTQIKQYTVEEARKVMVEHPEYLSEAEFKRVADMYPIGSADRTAVFDVMLQYYPTKESACINGAINAIEVKQYEKALGYLKNISNPGAKAVCLMGVAYARLGEIGMAKQCFEQAANAGDVTAKNNLTMLNGDQN